MGPCGLSPSKSGPKTCQCAHPKSDILACWSILPRACTRAYARRIFYSARARIVRLGLPAPIDRHERSGDDSALLARNPTPPSSSGTNLTLFSYFVTFGPGWLSPGMVNGSAGGFCGFRADPPFVTLRVGPRIGSKVSFTRSELARDLTGFQEPM